MAMIVSLHFVGHIISHFPIGLSKQEEENSDVIQSSNPVQSSVSQSSVFEYPYSSAIFLIMELFPNKLIFATHPSLCSLRLRIPSLCLQEVTHVNSRVPSWTQVVPLKLTPCQGAIGLLVSWFMHCITARHLVMWTYNRNWAKQGQKRLRTSGIHFNVWCNIQSDNIQHTQWSFS
jgi:hypothetical protein